MTQAHRAGIIGGQRSDDARRGTPAEVLPHGLGWFTGTHSGERIVWQFGVTENASSALIVTMPDRHTTYILMANSSRLAEPAPLSVGQLVASPFLRVLLTFFVG